MNAERILIAAECIGDGRWFIDNAATRYAGERVVFGRPIGSNQGVQFPLARAPRRTPGCGPDALQGRLAVRAGQAVRCRGQHGEAARQPRPRGRRRNAAIDTHGGFGFAEEYDIERKFRETRLYQVAPISNNLVLAFIGQHVLGMPRSY